MTARILCIGGSDSGAGAGIQADLKTVMALGGYATTAITMLTAQDTHGVQAVMGVPAAFLRAQIAVALNDPGADVVKTGALHDAEAIGVLAALLAPAGLPIIVDPVLAATSGRPLLAPAAIDALVRTLLPLAALVTPNVPEAALLTGRPIPDLAGMHDAAAALLATGVQAVLLKGGHMPGDIVTDLLATAGGITIFEHARLVSRHTHGTGCTLASAIATGLAQGMTLTAAITRARRYVHDAIASAPGLGGGAGPLNHAVRL